MDINSLPSARLTALRLIMRQRRVPEAQIDSEIARYLAGLDAISVPSEAELRVMDEQGTLPVEREVVHSPK
jgi:hypothetical protein